MTVTVTVGFPRSLLPLSLSHALIPPPFFQPPLRAVRSSTMPHIAPPHPGVSALSRMAGRAARCGMVEVQTPLTHPETPLSPPFSLPLSLPSCWRGAHLSRVRH